MFGGDIQSSLRDENVGSETSLPSDESLGYYRPSLRGKDAGREQGELTERLGVRKTRVDFSTLCCVAGGLT